MKSDTHIDKIFKDGIGGSDFSNVDAMWQRMEQKLDDSEKQKKRPFVFILLIAGLLTAGLAVKYLNEPAVQTGSPIAKNGVPLNIDRGPTVNGTNAMANQLLSVDNDRPSGTPAAAIKKVAATVFTKSRKPLVHSTASTIINSETPSTIEETAVEELFGKIPVQATVLALQYARAAPPVIRMMPAPKTIAVAASRPIKRAPVQPKKISIEAIAGTDALRMNRKAGYYAGIRVNRLLETGTVISVGLNYTSHTVNDKYRLSAKPAELRGETDARINDIRTIRVPVYFQRQMANSKFALMAGLVPTYVMDATVYNMPSSFTGNPDQFRKFTLKDINRFNVLFGAGLKYSPVQRISFEISGSYGFTSLVKSSYINQSRVNDNFKSIQAGVVLMLK
jgi:hypothetical protein